MINLDPRGNRDLVITNNFLRNGLCHHDRWEVFFEHVVTKYNHQRVWIHWPSVYPWIKQISFRGDDSWLARDFISLWEQGTIRSIPQEFGDEELDAIVAFKNSKQVNFRVIVGNVDEWLKLREFFDIDDLAY